MSSTTTDTPAKDPEIILTLEPDPAKSTTNDLANFLTGHLHRQGIEDIIGHLQSLHLEEIAPSSSEHLLQSSSAVELDRIIGGLIEDETQWKRILKMRGESAQRWLDFLQAVSEFPGCEATTRGMIFKLILNLSKRSERNPTCFTIKNVERLGNHPVGGGGFADVWKGKIEDRIVCLKVVKPYILSDVRPVLKEYIREAIVWKQLVHPNVLPFIGLYYLDEEQEQLCLVSPWMEQGNLVQYLNNNKGSTKHFTFAQDIAAGLVYLHGMNIVHGDIKGLNILITPEERACIGDFGLSRVTDTFALKVTSTYTSTFGGTTRWQAPELLRPPPSPPSRESDMYAYGGVCYEIFTGRPPFYDLTDGAVVVAVLIQRAKPSRPHGIPDHVWNFMLPFWNEYPNSRPTASEVLTRIQSISSSSFASESSNGSSSMTYPFIFPYQHPEVYNYLPDNGLLARGHGIRSENERVKFVLSYDGDLLLLHDGRVRWSIAGKDIDFFAMNDGNCIAYKTNGDVVGVTNTKDDAVHYNRLFCQNDGNLVVYGGERDTVIWHTDTSDLAEDPPTTPTLHLPLLTSPPFYPTEFIYPYGSALPENGILPRGFGLISPNTRCVFHINYNGFLELFYDGIRRWLIGGKDVAYLIIQRDGSLVGYMDSGDGHRNAAWLTAEIVDKRPFRLACQDDGNLVLYGHSGTEEEEAVWASGTDEMAFAVAQPLASQPFLNQAMLVHPLAPSSEIENVIEAPELCDIATYFGGLASEHGQETDGLESHQIENEARLSHSPESLRPDRSS